MSEKTICCNFCDKKYKDKSGLRYHMNKYHINESQEEKEEKPEEKGEEKGEEKVDLERASRACSAPRPRGRRGSSPSVDENVGEKEIEKEKVEEQVEEKPGEKPEEKVEEKSDEKVEEKQEIATLDKLTKNEKKVPVVNYNLPYWDPIQFIEKYKNPNYSSVIIVYGMKNSGKSTLIHHLMNNYLFKLFDAIFLITGNEHNKEEYINHCGIEPKKIFSTLDDPKTSIFLDNIIKFQNITNKSKRIMLIMDDIIDSSNKQHNNSKLDSIISNCRHYNISILIASQAVKKISPMIRKNCDVGFMFYTKSQNELEALEEDYFDPRIKKDAFNILHENTKNYNCVVVHPYQHDNYLYTYNAKQK